MTPEERAARISDARALLDILDADPSLPLPHELGHAGFFFRADGTPGTARRELAALESAIPAGFDGGLADDNGDWSIFGMMRGGVKAALAARLWLVAEEVEAPKEVVTKTWVRLPAGPESGDGK